LGFVHPAWPLLQHFIETTARSIFVDVAGDRGGP
jgi:hypothetical protein